MARLGLRLNLARKAPSQYVGYGFSSIGHFAEKAIGIDENGIYELFTGDSDDAKNIDAHFDIPQTNLRTSRNKHLRSFYLGCRADGQLFITVTDDEEYEHTYSVIPSKFGKQHTSKVPCGRKFNKGSYYSFRLGNINGSYFDIDFVQALAILLSRQTGGF